jgi:hypothetical protein
MRPDIAAVAVLAIAASGCGQTMALTPSHAKTPLTVSAPPRLCPPSDAKPHSILSRSVGDVLVPGHPTSALICRYWGRSGENHEPEDLHAGVVYGEHGHAERSLAGARRVVRQDIARQLARELDALQPIGAHANCDEVLGDPRSRARPAFRAAVPVARERVAAAHERREVRHCEVDLAVVGAVDQPLLDEGVPHDRRR